MYKYDYDIYIQILVFMWLLSAYVDVVGDLGIILLSSTDVAALESVAYLIVWVKPYFTYW